MFTWSSIIFFLNLILSYRYLIVVAFLIYLRWIYVKHHGRINYYISKIPSPKTIPIFGNLNLFSKGLINIFTLSNVGVENLAPYTIAMCKFFYNEKIFVLWYGWEANLIACKPQAVEKILTSTTILDKSNDYKYLYPWLGTGLLTSTGNKWQSRRKLLTPAFHFQILNDFIPVFNEQSNILITKLLNKVNKGIVEDIVPFISRCTLDIISETAMGVKINAQSNHNSDYVKAVNFAAESLIYRLSNFFTTVDWIFYRTANGKKYSKCLKTLHDFTTNVIRERKQVLKNNHTTSEAINSDDGINRKTRLAFLDLLLKHHLSDIEPKLTEEDIREEVDTFMFEGHDTTAMGISWTLYMIGLHDHVQEKIHDELNQIFGDDKERPIDLNDLKQMKYLENCLKEALRLYPSVPVIGRYFANDCEIEGYNIPAGSVVSIVIFQLHRDPQIYPNPEVFNPDRFLPEEVSKRNPFAYLPFSAGPRNCIGQKFALLEEKIIIANVLRNFRIKSLNAIDKIKISFEMVTRPKSPLSIQFISK